MSTKAGKKKISFKKNIQSRLNALLGELAKTIERPLPGHKDARWFPAPDRLSGYMSAKETCKPEELTCWKYHPDNMGHRDIEQAGVLQIYGAGVAGYTLKSGSDSQSILNLVDRFGRPLFFPFKKHWKPKSLFQDLSLGPSLLPGKKRKNAAVLGSSNTGYYHFLTEVVGDLWFFEQMGFDRHAFDLYIIHDGEKQWQQEILDILGIDRSKRIPSSRVWQKNLNLVIPYRSKGDPTNLPSWNCAALIETLAPKGPTVKSGGKVYISRKDATRRRMLNEDDLKEKLAMLGFKICQLDGMSIREQQELFASSSIVIAEHGAALSNLVWCPDDAVIVDIHQGLPAVPCFMILAAQRGIRYFPVFNAAEEIYKYADWKISTQAIDAVVTLAKEN